MDLKNYVVRYVGNMILLVNIKNNEILQIDGFTADCIAMYKKEGCLNATALAGKYDMAVAEVENEWNEILTALEARTNV